MLLNRNISCEILQLKLFFITLSNFKSKMKINTLDRYTDDYQVIYLKFLRLIEFDFKTPIYLH